MKRTFSNEFKIKACELVLKDGIKHMVVAEKFGINHIMLYSRINQYKPMGTMHLLEKDISIEKM